MTTKWIEIFTAGTHEDSRGRRKKYTMADLDRIVAKFKKNSLDVPAVVGHPKTSDPAYGWVSALKRVGSRLYAKFVQVDKAFWAAVKAGRFKKRSVALSSDGALVHVGWLGAVPPAVEGMKDAFSKRRKKGRIYLFKEAPMKGKKKKSKYMGMDDDMSKKKRRKATKKMKGMKKKVKKYKARADEYEAFMAPATSRKRVKARQKRVKNLVKDQKITPADQKGVLSYAAALSRETKKVKVNGKKRTLEDHFLTGLENGDDAPIFREFSPIPDSADWEDDEDGQSLESVVKEAGFSASDTDEED